MSDYQGNPGDVNANLGAEGEVPAEVGQVEETAPTSAPSEPQLSPAQVQQMIVQAMAQADQVWTRRLQSQMDRRDSNLIKRIEASKLQADRVVKTAKDRGVDEAAAIALGQTFLNEDIASIIDEANKPPARNGQQPAQSQEEYDDQQQYLEAQQIAAYQAWITKQGDEIRDAFDMPYDAPEMKDLVLNRGEDEYFQSIKNAGRKYQKRMASERQPARPARAPGLGPDGANAPNNPIAGIESSSELYKLAMKQERRQR